MGNEYNSRIEYYLDAIANGETPEIKPVNGIDYFLAKIAGMDVELPTPNTRIEECLATIAESGGGGGGSFTYVIPEQTVTLPESVGTTDYAEITVDDSSLVGMDALIVKVIESDVSSYFIGTYYNEIEDEESYIGVSLSPIGNDEYMDMSIAKFDGVWGIQPNNSSAAGKTITISAIDFDSIGY